MSDNIKTVCLVNGSLRGKESASRQFFEDIAARLPEGRFLKTLLTVRLKVKDRYPAEMLNKLAAADAVVFVFPLHNYGLPGAFMRLLEDYYRFIMEGAEYNRQASVYMVVNCAFPRPAETCGEAIRIMQNFCRRLGLNWRFAVCIGTGPVVAMTRKIPFVYRSLRKAYADIVEDLQGEGKESKKDYFIRPIIPESIIAAIKRRYEKKGRMIQDRQ